MIILTALLLIASPIIADSDQLGAIDDAFKCPESFKTDRDRIDELAQFDNRMAKAVPGITLDQLGEARMYLLRKHRCVVTLRNLRKSGVY